MRVSSRYAQVLTAIVGCVLASASAAHAGDAAPTPPSPPPTYHSGGHHGGHSGCCVHPGGPMIQPPGVHVGGPNVFVGGPNIHTGGINVNSNLNVNVNVNASASANASAMVGFQGSANTGVSNTIIYAGGGYVRGGSAPAATALSGLQLAGQTRVEYVEEERTRFIEQWRVIRAVCVDDGGTPHPASRPDPDERVNPGFDGEIFRCMAGTAMQVTLGWRENGTDRYNGGQTLACRKGEALRHERGGRIYCAPEEARRNCNERSLLRQHGPGVKLVYVRVEETYTERVEREVESNETSSMTLILNGGVGGYW